MEDAPVNNDQCSSTSLNFASRFLYEFRIKFDTWRPGAPRLQSDRCSLRIVIKLVTLKHGATAANACPCQPQSKGNKMGVARTCASGNHHRSKHRSPHEPGCPSRNVVKTNRKKTDFPKLRPDHECCCCRWKSGRNL